MMTKKRAQIQRNLVENAIAAMQAAVELHNKVHMPYRYETVTLLVCNAWELILKAYIKKYVKHSSIFEKPVATRSDEQQAATISLSKALSIVVSNPPKIQEIQIQALSTNIETLCDYRNNVAHFHAAELDMCIYSLIAQTVIFFSDFVEQLFSKSLLKNLELYILPIGFKLPFEPADFLAKSYTSQITSKEVMTFLESVVHKITDLKNQSVDQTILLTYSMYLISQKKATNADIVSSVVPANDVFDVAVHKKRVLTLSDDPKAEKVIIDENNWRGIWKYTYTELRAWCVTNIPNFKQNKTFYTYVDEVKTVDNYAKERKLDSNNPKSPKQFFYSQLACDYIRSRYDTVHV